MASGARALALFSPSCCAVVALSELSAKLETRLEKSEVGRLDFCLGKSWENNGKKIFEKIYGKTMISMVSEVFRCRADFKKSYVHLCPMMSSLAKPMREALVVSPRPGQKLVKVAWHPMSDVTWMAKDGEFT